MGLGSSKPDDINMPSLPHVGCARYWGTLKPKFVYKLEMSSCNGLYQSDQAAKLLCFQWAEQNLRRCTSMWQTPATKPLIHCINCYVDPW